MSDKSAPPPPPIPPPLPPIPPQAWPPPGAQMAPPSYDRGAPRPAAVTAVAVASLIIAAVSLVGHALLLVVAGLTYARLAIPITTVGAPQPRTTAMAPSIPRTSFAKEGLGEQDRALAALVFTSRQPLSPKRQEHLDAMLAQHGKQVLGPAADGVGPLNEHVAFEANVDQGQMPSADPRREGPDYFRTVAGRLEITDDGAVFYPGRNVYAPIRAAARPKTLALTPAEIQAVVAQAQAASRTPLTAPQCATLGVLLGAPTQTLVPPGAPAAGQVVRSVTNQPDGVAVVTLPGGAVGLGSQGLVIISDGGAASANVTPAAASQPSLIPLVLTSLLQTALAAFLVVAAIVLLRRTRAGRRLHLIYAALEIPLAVLMVIVALRASAGADAPRVLGGLGVATGAVGLIYAAGLLWVLNARSVRDHAG
jgi:hypothetical protein